jgi:protein arginine N-methyltransferase 1
LIDESQINSIISTNPYGFDSGLIHTMMLNDRVRTSTFLAGIREIVRPGDVVVDIGTGTGILAIAAAHAGAKHVYAIEATEIGKTALSLFEANGLADKITLIQGWSTQISLPEPADVLVAEIIGNEPLGEKVLETTIDARKRLLNPEARMIPGRLKIFGLPVNIPSDELIKRGFTQEALKSWQDWYGINFSPIGMVINESPQSFPIKPQKARDWNIIADPILLADIDFRTVKQSMIDHTVDAIANTSGNLNGLLIYFELELSPNTHLSTHPAIADKDNHWSSLVWISTQSLILQKGDGFQVTYRYRVPGTQNKVLITRD